MPRQQSPLTFGGLGRILPAILLLLGAGLLGEAFAQTNTVGSISGTVKDANGAAISKAEVTVNNAGIGFNRTTTADDAGFYSFPSLPVGTYAVSASLSGFKKTVNGDVQLHVAENVVVNLVLEVGQVSETVTVTGGAQQIETRSGEISSLVGETQVTQLPINGRNYSNLVLLVPGMSPENRQGSGGAFQAKGVGLDGGVDVSSNGNGSNQNLWTVDGVNNMDVGSNRTLLVFPSVDSIAEFRVERNSYSAEFGQAQGAVINLITKGGTNQFHGGLWEFFRNDVLNATDTFLNAQNQAKGALRYNNFGGNFSGPIKKDRIFFFYSEEWRKERRGVTNSGRVPTAQERVGDFSGILTDTLPHDPITSAAFPGNKIPANKISAIGEAYLATYPLPTCPSCSGNNWVGAPLEPVNNRQDEIRGDASINSKTNLMVRWINETWTHGNAAGNFWGDSPFPTVSSDWNQPSFSFAVKLTNTISSTAVNEFQFSRAGNDITVSTNPGGQPLLNAFTSKFPTVFPSPGSGFGYPTTWAGDGYTSLWHEAPWANHEDLFIWKDDFSKVKGSHDFKMGMLFSHNIKNEQINGDNGLYVIQNSNNRTGNYIGDMLYLGLPFESYSEINSNVVDHGRWHDWEAYFNDQWKVRSNVTLSLGLRWSRYSAPYTATKSVSNYLPSLYNGKNPLSGLVLANNSDGMILNSYGKGFQPRLGIAWDISGDGKTVLRLGFGRFISRTNVIEDLNRMAQNPPWAQTVNSNWGGNATSLTDPATRTWETIGSTLPKQIAGVGPNTAFNAVNPNFKPPESWQWNLTLSHELFKDTIVEASYIGNHALHLWRRGINYNDIVPSARAENAQIISTGAANSAFVAANRLFPGLGPVTLSDSSGDSHYDAFQVWVNRRFSDRAAFQVAYTWSHAISNVPVAAFNSQTTDPFNYNLDRGDADLDRRQTFVADWVYQTPTLHNLGNSFTGQLGQKLLGDWQLNGIFSYFGGPPVYANISSGVNTAGLAAFPGAGFRPNTVPGACVYNCSGDGFQYLNPAAFALPAYGTFGELGAGSIRLPSTWNVDFSVAKNFKIKERYGVQFRAEMFNAFNHAQYNQVDNALSFQGLVTSPQFGRSLNGDFGRLTHDLGPREIQFGLKFNF